MPRPIRAGGTDLRDLWFDRLGFNGRVAPNVLMLLETTRASGVVDLCSGGGGGTRQMRRKVCSGNPAEVVLSDRNPNKAAMARVDTLGDPATRYRAGSVDAMTGGGKRNGIRTRRVRRGGSRR